MNRVDNRAVIGREPLMGGRTAGAKPGSGERARPFAEVLSAGAGDAERGKQQQNEAGEEAPPAEAQAGNAVARVELAQKPGLSLVAALDGGRGGTVSGEAVEGSRPNYRAAGRDVDDLASAELVGQHTSSHDRIAQQVREDETREARLEGDEDGGAGSRRDAASDRRGVSSGAGGERLMKAIAAEPRGEEALSAGVKKLGGGSESASMERASEASAGAGGGAASRPTAAAGARALSAALGVAGVGGAAGGGGAGGAGGRGAAEAGGGQRESANSAVVGGMGGKTTARGAEALKAAAGGGAPVDRQEQVARIAAQAMRGIEGSMKLGGETVTLELSPQNLGDLRVTLTIKDGRAEALLESGTRTARDLLESACDDLKASLEGRGLTVERIEVRHAERAADPERAEDRGSVELAWLASTLGVGAGGTGLGGRPSDSRGSDGMGGGRGSGGGAAGGLATAESVGSLGVGVETRSPVRMVWMDGRPVIRVDALA